MHLGHNLPMSAFAGVAPQLTLGLYGALSTWMSMMVVGWQSCIV